MHLAHLLVLLLQLLDIDALQVHCVLLLSLLLSLLLRLLLCLLLAEMVVLVVAKQIITVETITAAINSWRHHLELAQN